MDAVVSDLLPARRLRGIECRKAADSLTRSSSGDSRVSTCHVIIVIRFDDGRHRRCQNRQRNDGVIGAGLRTVVDSSNGRYRSNERLRRDCVRRAARIGELWIVDEKAGLSYLICCLCSLYIVQLTRKSIAVFEGAVGVD